MLLIVYIFNTFPRPVSEGKPEWSIQPHGDFADHVQLAVIVLNVEVLHQLSNTVEVGINRWNALSIIVSLYEQENIMRSYLAHTLRTS